MLSIITGLNRSGKLRVYALAASLAMLAAACDKMPLLAPRESTIKLSTASTVVQANGTTEVRATVLESSGTPVQNGTTVTFTTTLGTFAPPEARTLNGVATVQFLGNGQSGKASIKALSGGAASDALELSVGAGAASRVSVNATPPSVPPAGGSTSISALVVDASGNALAGVPVTFTTTAGSFSAAVVNTDTAGVARTTLSTTSAANVTATAGGTTSTVLNVTVSTRPTVSITASATPAEGGITTFTITANAATGGSPIQSVVVNYGDGSSDDLGSVSGSITVQHVYGDAGSYTPTVTATDTSGATASASTVIVVQPIIVAISATPTGLTVSFTATVTPPGVTPASFAWTFGDGASQTTSTGTTSHTYKTSGDKTVRVTVRTSTNKTASGSTTVNVQ